MTDTTDAQLSHKLGSLSRERRKFVQLTIVKFMLFLPETPISRNQNDQFSLVFSLTLARVCDNVAPNFSHRQRTMLTVLSCQIET